MEALFRKREVIMNFTVQYDFNVNMQAHSNITKYDSLSMRVSLQGAV